MLSFLTSFEMILLDCIVTALKISEFYAANFNTENGRRYARFLVCCALLFQ